MLIVTGSAQQHRAQIYLSRLVSRCVWHKSPSEMKGCLLTTPTNSIALFQVQHLSIQSIYFILQLHFGSKKIRL